jgi:hypothetical protein
VTIFGSSWSELALADVEAFLEQADDEPLLWEAKGTSLDKNEVRRQVCAFANSHEGGYVILGADRDRTTGNWQLDGVAFPDEPAVWISQVVGDPERGVRPRPTFDVVGWSASNGHVAVVRVKPTSTPPCIANGTVFERVPGVTQTVRDPMRLAELFARGDEARRGAQLRADRAAQTLMEQSLRGDAGVFRTAMPLAGEADLEQPKQQLMRFAVGVAASGNGPDIAGRLFQTDFADEVRRKLSERPTGLPPGYGLGPGHAEWSQEALTWRYQITGPLDSITIVRAAWDGSVAAGQVLASDDFYPDTLVDSRVATEWRLSDDLLQLLGGYGDIYVTVLLVGSNLPRRPDPGYVVMQRGPLSPGVEQRHIDSLRRELLRTLGRPEPEPTQ